MSSIRRENLGPKIMLSG
ncbi:hypothetical protein TIFTF001_015543 [Ficus carica]|uniref:Uncharacterized protein n=1 Tax=Ficus carica TaxID=3494 RepID=A0AA88A1E3_FICCA|nr:hypothetical protein TIFTF001_015543 [Ficus carica]